MPRINGLVPVGGKNIYWQMIDPPGVGRDELVIAVPRYTLESVLDIWRFGDVDWIGIPENLSSKWVFDLDRLRERLDQDLSQGFPEWVRGKAAVAPNPGGGVMFEVTPGDLID